MSIKTVLCVFSVERWDQDIKQAIEFCDTQRAHMTALMVCLGGVPAIATYEAISTAWLDKQRKEIERLTEETKAVQKLLESSGLSFAVQRSTPSSRGQMKISPSTHFMPTSYSSVRKPPATSRFSMVMPQFISVPYLQWQDMGDGIRFRFWNAGHMLGSVSIEVELTGADDMRRVLFSGDVRTCFQAAGDADIKAKESHDAMY